MSQLQNEAPKIPGFYTSFVPYVRVESVRLLEKPLLTQVVNTLCKFITVKVSVSDCLRVCVEFVIRTEWGAGENACLPPICLGSMLSQCHMWVEFVVGSRLALRVFLWALQLIFLPLQEPTSANSNLIMTDD